MSLAGVRSNRGDAYQTFIALNWAIRMIADESITAIEVDSTLLDPAGNPVSVDDVVVHLAGGTKTFCQCKKNEPHHRSWTAGSLADELKKAARLLNAERRSTSCFYSASPFGELAKLREYAVAQADAAAYEAGLTGELRAVHAAFAALLSSLSIPASFLFDLITRIRYETVEFEGIEMMQRAQLSRFVSAADRAYEALWFTVDRLGARIDGTGGSSAPKTMLARAEALEIIRAAGSVPSTPHSDQEARRILARLSAVGRNWRRDVRGRRLKRDATRKIQNAIAERKISVLVTAAPGAGKTCVLLDTFEALGGLNDVVPVFVQCRSFADHAAPEARSALGYPPHLVGMAARLAEHVRVVVIFDSLDVLSLSREHGALTFFLTQIDQLLAADNVSVIAACRAFDSKYDSRLSAREWAETVELGDLDWHDEVAPVLIDWSVDPDSVSEDAKLLLRNPRNLAIFGDMLQRGVLPKARTQQDLTREYLSTWVRDDPVLGDTAIQALERIGEDLLRRRSLEISRERANLPQSVEKSLLSAGILQPTESGTIEFTHQTLLDVLAINAWERKGGSLSSFVGGVAPVPFVRPAIRAYVLYLASVDRRSLRTNVRAVVSSAIPHHIKRVVVETLADLEPVEDDWPMVSALISHSSLFDALYARTSSLFWYRFWVKHLVPKCVEERNATRLLSFSYKASDFLEQDPTSVIDLWSSLLTKDWIETERLAMSISFKIADYAENSTVDLEPLLRQLLALPRPDYDSLGRAMMRAASKGRVPDDLLWQYIAGDVDEESLHSLAINKKLNCEPHVFAEQEVLAKRMQASDLLLDLAIGAVERWHSVVAKRYRDDVPFLYGFLGCTTYVDAHSKHDIRHVSDDDVLFRAIEAGVLERARKGDEWWSFNRLRLARSREGAFRYWVLKALTENPHLDLQLAAELATEESMMTYSLTFEVGEMLNKCIAHMTHAQQTMVLNAIDALPVSEYLSNKAQLALSIPAFLRTPPMLASLDESEKHSWPVLRRAHIESSGGTVKAPFGFSRFLDADDCSVIRLLKHYAGADSMRDWGELIGGSDEIAHQLKEAATRAPVRFVGLLGAYWSVIPDIFRDGFLSGATTYLSYLHGGLQNDKNHWKPVEQPDSSDLASLILLEIERHPAGWDRKRVTADALQAVSHVLPLQNVDRLSFQLLAFLSAEWQDSAGDLLTIGINAARGNAADAAMILVNRLLEAGTPIPSLLQTAVTGFCEDSHEAVKAVILRRLPYLTSMNQELGWDLFDRCTAGASASLWRVSEPCLYHAYHRQFDRVAPALERLLNAVQEESGEDDGDGNALATWARISALASLSGHIGLEGLKQELSALDREQAWLGATSVWIANAHLPEHLSACVDGLSHALGAPSGMLRTATGMERMFDRAQDPLCVPSELVRRMFAALRQSVSERKHYHPHWFLAWIANTSKTNVELSLSSLEELAQFLAETGQTLYDSTGDIPKALTELFREAEERELSDGGVLLRRVIEVQDRLLTIGVHGLEEWLKAAERP